MMERIEREFAGRRLVLEVGRMARLAHGACLVQYGETVVLVTATVQNRQTHLPFFPLTVEYREKSYAAGKIPGGFFKREGAPQEKEVLSARLADRTLRPLFPDGFFHETQIHAQVLSADQENDADVLTLIGASVALNTSVIPFRTPVASVRIGRIQGNWVVNPTFRQLEYADVDVVVAGTAKAIVMVEGGAIQVPESEILEGLVIAHDAIRELIEIQEVLIAPRRKPEMSWEPRAVPTELRKRIEDLVGGRVADAVQIPDKTERATALSAVTADVARQLADENPEGASADSEISDVIRSLEKKSVRARILDQGIRADGRGVDDVRPIVCETSLLPRAHGSALFTRGETQSLGVVTLGTSRDEQRIDSIDTPEQITKSFMLHYNFPPFSVGEARPIRSTSRREKGHGALAERAIQPLLPDYDDFPYTIRIVSDILESNGSSSMASVCSASLSLMDAGVPVRASCAGVAMGLVTEGDKVVVLTDILGLEDALGDMDFKVAGTRKGVTSIQMDIKVDGLTVELLTEALKRARTGRMHILDRMDAVLSAPRDDLSQHAPRIVSLRINPEKIGEIIGPKGKTIRAIQEESGATIEVDDDGVVKIAAVSGEAGRRAREMIEAIVQEPEVGRIYEGPVKNTTTFGAFVEIMPGIEGLCHISQLADYRVGKTEDVVNRGDVVRVKLLSIDERGRMRLSMKAAAAEEGSPREEQPAGARS
ncbi:MAG: polyribonucleotide nucleotidyltransferase [Gemmatimonadetes bacterium]|nr:polyribonucleotide nucleotidyltransferase [Gemmatimonadota bacterium]MXX70337.1 polyribonucleotide nucleotidyltransferase [Gemmatimonadota bacterium]MYC91591.1 polyribonucleotide nucleotidyltransferase [Gemmatimonadota bacterium]MYG34296.1 polyribonucleotide nucleotidyltransferase [Gemmatimonadota bacterium]